MTDRPAWRRRVGALLVGVVLASTAASATTAPAPASATTASMSVADIPEPVQAKFLRNLQYVQSDPSALDSTSSKSASVTCPEGTVVVGTGVQMAYNTGEEFVSRIVPTETTVSVTAQEDETGDSDDWSITALATCASRPDDYTIESTQSGERSVSTRTQSAYCPHGTVPLGLGWAIPKAAGDEITVTEARPLPGASATISAAEDDTGLAADWSLEAFVICADVDGWEVMSETHLTPGTYQVHNAWCSEGRLAISAGFTVNLDRDVLVSHFYGYPEQDYSYVIAKEDEDGSSDTWTFTVDAICVTPAPEIGL